MSRAGKQSVPRTPAPISAARRVAFEILELVGQSRGHSDELLHSSRTAALSTEDRNLATALVMGALRWQIALDARIGKHLDRPGQRLAEPVLIALRLGAFQLLHMDRIPPHAAINESVELCRAAGQPHAAGMVNAILRKLSTAARPGVPIFESAASFAERLGHPAWLVERWAANYGREAALAVCEYDQREPGPGTLFRHTDALSAIELNEPEWQMDDGSRLVAEIAAAAVPSHAAAPRVWDCCAAPGGKTLVLASRLPTAEILATDISPKRLARMETRLRSHSQAERVCCQILDAASPEAAHTGLFDLILCDAPCSGTGTLARNPEIRHHLRPEDLSRQALRQRKILGNALQRLAPGARLVYSTCSLEPEENERVLEQLLAKQRGIERLSVQPFLAALAHNQLLSPESRDALLGSGMRDGCLRTLPGVHPCDGFFTTVLHRN